MFILVATFIAGKQKWELTKMTYLNKYERNCATCFASYLFASKSKYFPFNQMFQLNPREVHKLDLSENDNCIFIQQRLTFYFGLFACTALLWNFSNHCLIRLVAKILSSKAVTTVTPIRVRIGTIGCEFSCNVVWIRWAITIRIWRWSNSNAKKSVLSFVFGERGLEVQS